MDDEPIPVVCRRLQRQGDGSIDTPAPAGLGYAVKAVILHIDFRLYYLIDHWGMFAVAVTLNSGTAAPVSHDSMIQSMKTHLRTAQAS